MIIGLDDGLLCAQVSSISAKTITEALLVARQFAVWKHVCKRCYFHCMEWAVMLVVI